MQTDHDLIQAARYRFEQGEFDAAEADYRELLDQLPAARHPDLHLLIAACRQARGRIDESLDSIREAIELDDHRAESWFQLGRLRRVTGDEDGAREALGRAIELDPNHALARTERGRQQLAEGDGASAELHFRTALRADPDCVPALVALADYELANDRADKAHELAARAVGLNPDHVEAQLAMARSFHRQGHPDFAEQCLTNALSKAPDQPDLHLALARLQQQRGRAEAALAAVGEARRCGAAGEPPAMVEARALQQLGQGARARQRLEAARQESGLSPTALLMLAELRLAGDDADGAGELLESLAAGWPEAAELLRAWLEERQGDSKRAGERAAALHQSTSAHLRRQARLLSGRLAAAAGDTEGCVDALEPLVADGADDAFVHWMLAQSLDRAGRFEAAGPHLERAGWRTPPLLARSDEFLPAGLLTELEHLDPSGWPAQPPADDRPQPVFLLGWPGSGRDQLAGAVADHARSVVLDPRANARRRKVLDLPAWPSSLAALDETQLRLKRKRYFRDAPREAARVLEPLWLSAADLPALARGFPGATVVLADADERDLELDWRLSGFREIEAMRSLWRREQALLEALLERLPLDIRVFSRSDLEREAQEVAGELCACLDLDDPHALAGAIERRLVALRPTGHWRHYRQLFDRAPADSA